MQSHAVKVVLIYVLVKLVSLAGVAFGCIGLSRGSFCTAPQTDGKSESLIVMCIRMCKMWSSIGFEMI